MELFAHLINTYSICNRTEKIQNTLNVKSEFCTLNTSCIFDSESTAVVSRGNITNKIMHHCPKLGDLTVGHLTHEIVDLCNCNFPG